MVSEKLLASWGMCGVVAKEKVRDRLLEASASLNAEQKNNAIAIYLSSLKIQTDEDLQRFVLSEGLTKEELASRAERHLRWLHLCEQRFRQKVSSLFLKRKSQLDCVVYSLHWIADMSLAQELFLRLKEGECRFEELASFSPVKSTDGLLSGKFGPVPLGEISTQLAELLRVSEPGQLWPPQEVEGGWMIIQLNQLQPAMFNQSVRRELCLELGDLWIQESMQQKLTKSS